MPKRTSSADWLGGLKDGEGKMRFGSGAYEGGYSFGSRFEEGTGTNPEELIAAAHAGCFSMALSGELGKAGHTAERVSTHATVHLDKQQEGFAITRIVLETEGVVPGIDQDIFQRHAQDAAQGCPVSKLVRGAEVEVNARLVS